MTDSGAEMDYLSAIEASWAVCQPIMAAFGEADGDKTTPCAEYTVNELTDHLMGSLRSLGGMAGAEFPESIEGSTLEDSVSQATAITLAAWKERGTDGEVQFGENMVPAVMPAGILCLEYLVHAWDFAQATGQSISVDDGLVAFVDGAARQIIRPGNRGEGHGFGQETDASADDPLTRLMAFTGRQT
jgi:uncharacterized protein (TIGR03086 family)